MNNNSVVGLRVATKWSFGLHPAYLAKSIFIASRRFFELPTFIITGFEALGACKSALKQNENLTIYQKAFVMLLVHCHFLFWYIPTNILMSALLVPLAFIGLRAEKVVLDADGKEVLCADKLDEDIKKTIDELKSNEFNDK